AVLIAGLLAGLFAIGPVLMLGPFRPVNPLYVLLTEQIGVMQRLAVACGRYSKTGSGDGLLSGAGLG
ncbi:MAG: hypothetical protein ABGW82_02935, partial [Paracoccus sp. (in: a-proteobacteria)]